MNKERDCNEYTEEERLQECGFGPSFEYIEEDMDLGWYKDLCSISQKLRILSSQLLIMSSSIRNLEIEEEDFSLNSLNESVACSRDAEKVLVQAFEVMQSLKAMRERMVAASC